MSTAKDYHDLGLNGERFYNKLKKYKNCKMVDLGVRTGVSSAIMLEDSIVNNNKVFGVDITKDKVNQNVLNHINYTFILDDSVKAGKQWDSGKIDVLFVDTLHIKEQVLNELYVWMRHLNEHGLVVFHDTNWPDNKRDFYNGKYWDRPEHAIKEYFNLTELNYKDEYLIVENYPESWGMTFVNIINKSPYFGKNVDWVEVLKFCSNEN